MKSFKEFINEGLTDAMVGKTETEIKNALIGKTKNELILSFIKTKENFIIDYISDKFKEDMNPLNFNIEEIANGYFETALWTEELDGVSIYDVDFDRETVEKEIKLFVMIAGDWLEGFEHESTIGHNLWLNRNGHGSGFWDAVEVDNETGEKLSNVSKILGHDYNTESTLYNLKDNEDDEEYDDED